MIIEESTRSALDELLKTGLINRREREIAEMLVLSQVPAYLMHFFAERIKDDIAYLIGCEYIKNTDNLVIALSKFYWEQSLLAFEKKFFGTHNEVLKGIKNLLEDLVKPVNLEVSIIGEREMIKIITDFYVHGCPKTDKVSISIKNLYFDPRFEYASNWLEENGIKVTNNWSEFSQSAQGTIVVGGGWSSFLGTMEFLEKIFYLITRKVPIILLNKVEYFETDNGARNLSDALQVSLFEDGQLALSNGNSLIIKPYEKITSSTSYPFDKVEQTTFFSMPIFKA